MKGKRRKYSAALKAKVGLEATLGVKTVAQSAREYESGKGVTFQHSTIGSAESEGRAGLFSASRLTNARYS